MNHTYTKQRLSNAFYNLLKKKHSINKITVDLIIKKSGVAKSTFYRHFKDKFDVLNYNSMFLAEHIIDQSLCTSWEEFLFCMFQGIENDIYYYKKAFLTSGQNDHSDFLYQYSFSIVEKCYLTYYNKTSISAADRILIAHYCHGCVGILQDWLNSPNSISSEEMASIFYESMPLFLRDTWFNA